MSNCSGNDFRLSYNFDNFWCHQFTGNLWLGVKGGYELAMLVTLGHAVVFCFFFFPVGVYFNLASETYFIQYPNPQNHDRVTACIQKGSELFCM